MVAILLSRMGKLGTAKNSITEHSQSRGSDQNSFLCTSAEFDCQIGMTRAQESDWRVFKGINQY